MTRAPARYSGRGHPVVPPHLPAVRRAERRPAVDRGRAHPHRVLRSRADRSCRPGASRRSSSTSCGPGAVELVDEEQVLDLLSEGEVFGHPSLLSRMSPVVSVRAHEDCICYLIDREVAEDVLGTHSGLAFLSSTLRRRVVRALDGIDPSAVDPWQTPVGSLVRRPPGDGARSSRPSARPPSS